MKHMTITVVEAQRNLFSVLDVVASYCYSIGLRQRGGSIREASKRKAFQQALFECYRPINI